MPSKTQTEISEYKIYRDGKFWWVCKWKKTYYSPTSFWSHEKLFDFRWQARRYVKKQLRMPEPKTEYWP